MERFFQVHEISATDRRNAILTNLEDEALQWFLWTTERYTFEDWNDFKLQMGRRFDDELPENIMHQFMDVKQSGTIK